MSVSINDYSNVGDTTLTAEIWVSGDKRNLTGQIKMKVNDSFIVCLVDRPSAIDTFCKKYNVELTRDARTGVEKYMDDLYAKKLKSVLDLASKSPKGKAA